MINRARGDIRWLAAAPAISGTGDWAASTALALALSLRWTPWRPAELGPAPRTTGP